jgi:hypothetical protein
MNRDRCLAVVSGAQLGVGLIGMGVAIKRRRAYDVLFLQGHSETVARDAALMGTAYSAPVVMLAMQAIMTLRLLRGPTASGTLVLGALGAAMVPGYLGETLGRQRLRPSGYDPLESSVVMIGVSLAAAMAALGLSSRRLWAPPG